MHSSIDLPTPAATRIAELEAKLHHAEERATVAEEQLRRVHVAVRAFKEKQLEARAAQLKAQIAANDSAAAEPADRASLYSSWATQDPSLDERLDEYLSNDFEPDRSRDWMLRS